MRERTMWTCPACGAQFFQKNLWHSCGRYSVPEFLKGKSARAIQLYECFLAEYRKIGPIRLHPVKSRIAFMVEIRFCAVYGMGRDHIRGHLVLTESCSSKRFSRVEFIPRSYYVHHFILSDESQIDDEFRTFMRMAYEVGERKHIRSKRADRPLE